jgi:PIN domain nuclease of toxin-antitoxin system
MPKSIFSLKSRKFTTDSRRSPLSLPHLIIGTRKLVHVTQIIFYEMQMKIKYGEVARSTRLNNYYTPKA